MAMSIVINQTYYYKFVYIPFMEINVAFFIDLRLLGSLHLRVNRKLQQHLYSKPRVSQILLQNFRKSFNFLFIDIPLPLPQQRLELVCIP